MEVFDNIWLCWYPRLLWIGYDSNGSEFLNVFKELCQNYGLTFKPTTEYMSQTNTMIERINFTLGNLLTSFQLEKQELNEENPFDEFLNAAVWALRST